MFCLSQERKLRVRLSFCRESAFLAKTISGPWPISKEKCEFEVV